MSITAVTCYESEGQGVPNTLLNLSGNTAIYNAQIFRSFFAVFFASLARFFKSFIVAMLQAHIPNAIHIPRFLSNSG